MSGNWDIKSIWARKEKPQPGFGLRRDAHRMENNDNMTCKLVESARRSLLLRGNKRGIPSLSLVVRESYWAIISTFSQVHFNIRVASFQNVRSFCYKKGSTFTSGLSLVRAYTAILYPMLRTESM